MNIEDIKIGDRILITGLPVGVGTPNYHIDPSTVRVFNKLAKRKRPVRISKIDFGEPWYRCRFKKANGKFEWHSLSIAADDKNWVKVEPSKNERLQARILELETAIKRVVTQEGDDLCWRDVYTDLAGLVGIEFVPQLMVDPDKFAANCKAFDKSMRTDGKYVPVHVRENGKK